MPTLAAPLAARAAVQASALHRQSRLGRPLGAASLEILASLAAQPAAARALSKQLDLPLRTVVRQLSRLVECERVCVVERRSFVGAKRPLAVFGLCEPKNPHLALGLFFRTVVGE